MSDLQNSAEFELSTPPESVYSYLLEPRTASTFLRWFGDSSEISEVGGKNASLSNLYNMCAVRSDTTLRVPNGFCISTRAYKHFLGHEGVPDAIHAALDGVTIGNMPSLM